MVRAKSVEFAVSLGNNNFKASPGWLDGCKDSNEISFRAFCGEVVLWTWTLLMIKKISWLML